MAAEWCEHDPPVLIHRKGDTPVQSRITYEGLATQDAVDALPSPDGVINHAGDLVIHVKAPPFPWACRVIVRWGEKRYASLAYGNPICPLAPGVDRRIVVTLPEVA